MQCCVRSEPRRRGQRIWLGFGCRRRVCATVGNRAALVVGRAVMSSAGRACDALARPQVSEISPCTPKVRIAYALRLTSVVDDTGQFVFRTARIGHAAGVAHRADFCVCHKRRRQTATHDQAKQTNTLRNCSNTEEAQHHLNFAFESFCDFAISNTSLFYRKKNISNKNKQNILKSENTNTNKTCCCTLPMQCKQAKAVRCWI